MIDKEWEDGDDSNLFDDGYVAGLEQIKIDYAKVAQAISVATRHIMIARDFEYLVMRTGNAFAEDNKKFDQIKWWENCNKDYWSS